MDKRKKNLGRLRKPFGKKNRLLSERLSDQTTAPPQIVWTPVRSDNSAAHDRQPSGSCACQPSDYLCGIELRRTTTDHCAGLLRHTRARRLALIVDTFVCRWSANLRADIRGDTSFSSNTLAADTLEGA